MPSFQVAHIREQGQNMLLFPLNSSFGSKMSDEQHSIIAQLEIRAHRAGLAGKAVAVWESGGQTYTIGPKPWAGFLRSISMHFVLRNVNKEISW